MIQGYYIFKTYNETEGILKDFNVLKKGEITNSKFAEALNFTDKTQIFLVNLFKGTLIICHNNTFQSLSPDFIKGRSRVITFKFSQTEFIYETLINSYRLEKQILKMPNYKNFIKASNNSSEFTKNDLFELLKNDTGFDLNRIDKNLSCKKVDIYCLNSSFRRYTSEKITLTDMFVKFRFFWVFTPLMIFLLLNIILIVKTGFQDLVSLVFVLIIFLVLILALFYDKFHRIRYMRKTWRNNFAQHAV